jgi:hypothetical protein
MLREKYPEVIAMTDIPHEAYMAAQAIDELMDYIQSIEPTPPAAQRQWAGLTPHERMMCRSYDIDTAIDKTEAKLKEKNL